ncbi:MAG: exostosin domain-containing protein [Sphingomicrobium sp.]
MTHLLRFVVMEGSVVDYPAIFRSALSRLGIPFSLDTYPHIGPAELNRAKLSHIRGLLRRRSADELVFFCPGSLEHFVEGADMSFQFSAYRSWFDPQRTEVLPHPWTQAWNLADRRALAWREKPPCAIGFMGSAYGDSRIARLAAKLPGLARSFLLQGRLVRSASRVALLDECNIPIRFMQSFARFEALEAVAASEDPLGESSVEIVNTNGFDFSAVSKEAFARHLVATTYVLCPRGAENYSFRAYEALRFGRVPVIIDADMVLPQQIDWDRLAIVVPSDRPYEIRARIIDDHRRLSSAAFLQRQAEAFAACDRLDGEGWLADSIQAAMERVIARRSVQ